MPSDYVTLWYATIKSNLLGLQVNSHLQDTCLKPISAYYWNIAIPSNYWKISKILKYSMVNRWNWLYKRLMNCTYCAYVLHIQREIYNIFNPNLQCT